MSNTDPTAALIDECHRQSENCSYTAASFTIWLRVLRGIRIFCVISPIIFGALATWKLLADSPAWSAVFVLLATVIPPAFRASAVEASINDYTLMAGEMTNLRDRFRHAAMIDSHKPFPEFEAAVKPLFDRLEKARARALTPPEWCFKLARGKHEAGHYTYDYDERSKSPAEQP